MYGGGWWEKVRYDNKNEKCPDAQNLIHLHNKKANNNR
jgi:hypothetical protein